jgi:uncharacterized protein (TIGR00297 family)
VKWLTPDGLVAACAVGAGVTWGLGWQGLAVLAAFFLSGSLLTQLAERGGGGPSRSARQVLANGGVALIAALFGSWPAAAGAVAAAAADTWATEIGAFSPFPPRLITSGRRMTRGTSGGITALGTLGGLAGAVLIAGLTHALARRGMAPRFAVLAAAGVAGMLADSVLGATLQAKYECPVCDARFERGRTVCHAPVRLARGWPWLDNDGVNLAATIIGAAAAVLGSHVSPP